MEKDEAMTWLVTSQGCALIFFVMVCHGSPDAHGDVCLILGQILPTIVYMGMMCALAPGDIPRHIVWQFTSAFLLVAAFCVYCLSVHMEEYRSAPWAEQKLRFFLPFLGAAQSCALSVWIWRSEGVGMWATMCANTQLHMAARFAVLLSLRFLIDERPERYPPGHLSFAGSVVVIILTSLLFHVASFASVRQYVALAFGKRTITLSLASLAASEQSASRSRRQARSVASKAPVPQSNTQYNWAEAPRMGTATTLYEALTILFAPLPRTSVPPMRVKKDAQKPYRQSLGTEQPAVSILDTFE